MESWTLSSTDDRWVGVRFIVSKEVKFKAECRDVHIYKDHWLFLNTMEDVPVSTFELSFEGTTVMEWECRVGMTVVVGMILQTR